MSKTFRFSIKKLGRILSTSECPACGHKMVCSPEIGVEEDGGKAICTKRIPYDRVLGTKVCLNCELGLDFDELLIIRDISEMTQIIEHNIRDAKKRCGGVITDNEVDKKIKEEDEDGYETLNCLGCGAPAFFKKSGLPLDVALCEICKKEIEEHDFER